ncbi:MAG: hypothetical protein MI924_10570 [Chloroflexales bacterium]|nr:hypothetical protein [Chloroflexales bacterium]
MIQILRRFGQRLRRKMIAIIPILLGSAGLLGVVSLLIMTLRPYLPGAMQHILDLAHSGDLIGGRDQLRPLLEGYGQAKYVIFLTIQVTQVVLAPIPG